MHSLFPTSNNLWQPKLLVILQFLRIFSKICLCLSRKCLSISHEDNMLQPNELYGMDALKAYLASNTLLIWINDCTWADTVKNRRTLLSPGKSFMKFINLVIYHFLGFINVINLFINPFGSSTLRRVYYTLYFHKLFRVYERYYAFKYLIKVINPTEKHFSLYGCS